MTSRKFSRRAFLKLSATAVVGAGVYSVGGYVYATGIEPGWIDVNEIAMPLPSLASEFNGYRVAHLSDIHMDDWMTGARLLDIVRLINAQQPDMVAITGDFVTGEAEPYEADLVAALSQLTPRDGTVAILGNHDHWTNPDVIRKVIRASGMIDLNNDVHTLTRSKAMLHFCGVDDIIENKQRLDLVLNRLPPDGAAVLLAHEPDFADESSAANRFDLQISGHSHGGQVAIPFMGPLVVPPMSEKYPVGRYQVGKMIQYTVRGVGMVQPRVRFNCRPEIAIYTLAAPTS